MSHHDLPSLAQGLFIFLLGSTLIPALVIACGIPIMWFFGVPLNSGRGVESSSSSWFATFTPSTPPYMQVLQACSLFWHQHRYTIGILSIAILIVVVAWTFLFLARWVLKALRFSFKPLLCVTALGLCVKMLSVWPALTVFKFFAFLASAFAFFGLIWWTLDVLWLCFYGWATSSTSQNVASTTSIRITSSTATASIPPTPPTQPEPTQAAHTFWGEFTLAARGVIVLASPLLAVLASYFVFLGSHGLVAAVYHGWALLRSTFTALGAKTLSGIYRTFAIVRADMLMMSAGSKTIIIVRPYGRRCILGMVKNKKQRTIKRQDSTAWRRALLATRSTTADSIIYTEAEKISQAISTTTPMAARTTEIKTDVLTAASKITRCSSAPDLRSLSKTSTLGLSMMTSLPMLTSNSSSSKSSSSSSSITTTTETTTATAPTAEAERARSETSNRVARGSILDPAYDMVGEKMEYKTGENISSSLPVCHAPVAPAVARQLPKSKVNKLSRMGRVIKKMLTRTPKPETIIAQDGVLNLAIISCKEPRCKGLSLKKVFERKLSSSSSTSASSSPSSMDSRRSSMFFSAGSFAADGVCAY